MKTYRLTAPDGTTYPSSVPGTMGGYRPDKIYGRLDCPSANSFLRKGHYAEHRVFFADENAAIAAGYRPCAKCMKQRYDAWKKGTQMETPDYPWKIQPSQRSMESPKK
ncbi:MAG: Ada metal-binding domain-containing protein [Verrucomicrobiota bacterium]